MTNHLLKTKELQYEAMGGKNTVKLDYILLESIVENTAYYGIEIVKHADSCIERETVKYISEVRQKVEELIDKMCNYDVTPVSLINILDDLCE